MMKKLETNWSSGLNLKDANKTYFLHAIYNPDKPQITLGKAQELGIEPNPTTMFCEKERLEEKDLPEGFKLSQKISVVRTDKNGELIKFEAKETTYFKKND